MRRGFTLIEILIATALFAGLMGMYGVVFFNVVSLEEYARSQRSFATDRPEGPKLRSLESGKPGLAALIGARTSCVPRMRQT